jgi:hypothetical protein
MNQALPVNDSTVAHKLVAETAAAMAHELYDALMQRDDWWKQWQAWHPGQTRKEMEDSFVRRNVAQLLPKARAVLAGMLAGPLNEGLKETIMEALTLDASLQRDTVH